MSTNTQLSGVDLSAFEIDALKSNDPVIKKALLHIVGDMPLTKEGLVKAVSEVKSPLPESWVLSNDSLGDLEIQKHDSNAVFASDLQAHAYAVSQVGVCPIASICYLSLSLNYDLMLFNQAGSLVGC